MEKYYHPEAAAVFFYQSSLYRKISSMLRSSEERLVKDELNFVYFYPLYI